MFENDAEWVDYEDIATKQNVAKTGAFSASQQAILQQNPDLLKHAEKTAREFQEILAEIDRLEIEAMGETVANDSGGWEPYE